MAVIFAREVTAPLTSLVKKLDEATLKHRNDDMGSFVVVLSEDVTMPLQLKDLVRKEKIRRTVLTLWDDKDNPEGYNLAPDADITVLLYVNRTVKVNHAFRKGELQEKDIDTILKGLRQILPRD